MEIIYRAKALVGLDNYIAYIAKDSPIEATKVAGRVKRAVNRLQLFPESGRAGSIPGTYELAISHLPCIAVYKVTEQVEILRIFHTSQDRG